MPKKILIVDDEQDILDLIKYNLETEGYTTLQARDGVQALNLAHSALPDLIILDVMLPGKDGWQVMRELRQSPETQHIPVIFLTARASEIDEVVGIELGADDYIVKPISIRKLLARVKMTLRRALPPAAGRPEVLNFGEVQINTLNYSVRVGGREVPFTKKEFEVLVFLAERPGRVITRETLLNEIWGDNVVVIDRTIDVHIRKIREKLGEQNMHLIETIKGVGYRMKAEN
ncbi:MAG: response regulator transcription factor [candidate division KSB1 bacterium]|nr:response regulator transcription factor [candidate division KSB1 bacterium]MDZ7273303.1 response regulator transcription factor [candidate division KSB1 bacterium]MDZ7285405.1 response regulator transcription factor [candidate division KSB1 bacterium]MDZ7298437.1 response regulator transcription factor [candidate division KSB1 bacterium]MDZ7308532.1 response regulator transcription factor [candidate division KSB1 bacterium]